MNREHERVKLHITVINSIMRKDPSGTTVTQSTDRHRESFDASNVLRVRSSGLRPFIYLFLTTTLRFLRANSVSNVAKTSF